MPPQCIVCGSTSLEVSEASFACLGCGYIDEIQTAAINYAPTVNGHGLSDKQYNYQHITNPRELERAKAGAKFLVSSYFYS